MDDELWDIIRKRAADSIEETVRQTGWPGVYFAGEGKKLLLPLEVERELERLRREEQLARDLANVPPTMKQLEQWQREYLDSLATPYRKPESKFKTWDITEVDEDDSTPDWDPKKPWAGYGPEYWNTEVDRICIWCGEVQESLEALDAHEADCE